MFSVRFLADCTCRSRSSLWPCCGQNTPGFSRCRSPPEGRPTTGRTWDRRLGALWTGPTGTENTQTQLNTNLINAAIFVINEKILYFNWNSFFTFSSNIQICSLFVELHHFTQCTCLPAHKSIHLSAFHRAFCLIPRGDRRPGVNRTNKAGHF